MIGQDRRAEREGGRVGPVHRYGKGLENELEHQDHHPDGQAAHAAMGS
jgi:hypothetical protein